MRDFHWAVLLKATRNAMKNLLLIVVALLALTDSQARAEDHLNLVVAIDLTRSVAAAGPDGKTDFEKNIEGVNRVLAQVPTGSRLAVIGITDRSFAQPYILMQARVPDAPGYFGERLNAAHAHLLHAWRQRAEHLSPDFKQTDIFGVMELASQIFDQDPGAARKALVIFSDMRESVPGLDFEHSDLIPALATMATRCGPAPDLNGVEVYVAGVDGAGKSMAYWQSLRTFWLDRFKGAAANPRLFSALREVPIAPQH